MPRSSELFNILLALSSRLLAFWLQISARTSTALYAMNSDWTSLKPSFTAVLSSTLSLRTFWRVLGPKKMGHLLKARPLLTWVLTLRSPFGRQYFQFSFSRSRRCSSVYSLLLDNSSFCNVSLGKRCTIAIWNNFGIRPYRISFLLGLVGSFEMYLGFSFSGFFSVHGIIFLLPFHLFERVLDLKRSYFPSVAVYIMVSIGA